MGVMVYTGYIGSIRYILMIHNRVVVKLEKSASLCSIQPKPLVMIFGQHRIKSKTESTIDWVNSTILQNKKEFAPTKYKFINIMK